MFATYSKINMSGDTYKCVADFKRNKFHPEEKPLAKISNKKQNKAAVKNQKPKKQTDFQKYYLRGDFPISVSFSGANRALKWLVSPEKIDLNRYLPIFLTGLTEMEEPFIFIGEQASLQAIAANGEKLIEIFPDLVLPLKKAIDSKETCVVIRGLKVFQALLTQNKKLSESLIPFYKNLLPSFARHIHHNANLGDQTEYSQKKRINISDLMIETLNMLEQNGGSEAFVNIKYMIPLYQSVGPKK